MVSAVRCQRIQACKHRCRYTNQCIIWTRVKVLMSRRGAVCFICWLLIKMWIVQRIYVCVCTSSTRRQDFAHSELQSHITCNEFVCLYGSSFYCVFVLKSVCFLVSFYACNTYVEILQFQLDSGVFWKKKATKSDKFAEWPREGASWRSSQMIDRTLSAHKLCSYYCLHFGDWTNNPTFPEILINFVWRTDRQIEFDGTTAFRNHRWRMCFGCKFFRKMYFICGWSW